jgi:hypothetical protein
MFLPVSTICTGKPADVHLLQRRFVAATLTGACTLGALHAARRLLGRSSEHGSPKSENED